VIRTGIGIDSHRFEPGRALILGGVDIPHEEGLAGHSDADVLTHAIIDALLGAAGLGDIGQHFPDTDQRFKDADSLELLRTVVVFLEDNGFRIVHVDSTVMMERPKLSPYRDSIRETLSAALRVGLGHVNVKATTGERMGFVGRGEGVAAMAVATLDRPEERPSVPGSAA
jgi:2-C-methyl-D-erythritol 2,4-cyclodiphosphate synthase